MNTLIVPAAGSGNRIGAGINKLFLPVAGKPLLQFTLERLCAAACVDEIIVAIAPVDEQRFADLLLNLPTKKKIRYVMGGETRQESVANALQKISPDSDNVLIHDGARPYIHSEDLENICIALQESAGAVLVQKVANTVKLVAEDGSSITTYPRERVFLAETPQGFRRKVLMDMYATDTETLKNCTDDCQLFEKLGKQPRLILAKHRNDKITFGEDLERFEWEMMTKGITRVGIGYDIHQTCEGRKLFLGGVEIKWDKGLLGHSDADVVMHALADALLGAAGLADIGTYFPDNNPQWENVAGKVLLAKVRHILLREGFLIQNVDVTVVAERPKLQPHIEAMKKNIADALRIAVKYVGVKATTNEKLGPVGKGSGIAAMATASIIERMINNE